MPDQVDLDALDRLIAAATPGPWTRTKPQRDADGWPMGVGVAGCGPGCMIYASPPAGSFPSSDAELIAALRNAAPALIAELRAARAELARMRDVLATRDEALEFYREVELRAELARMDAELRAARSLLALIENRTTIHDDYKRDIRAFLEPRP